MQVSIPIAPTSSGPLAADPYSLTIDRGKAVHLLSQCEELATALRAALEVEDGPLPTLLASRLRYRFTRLDGLTLVGAYVLRDYHE